MNKIRKRICNNINKLEKKNKKRLRKRRRNIDIETHMFPHLGLPQPILILNK